MSDQPVILRARSPDTPLGRIRVAVRSPREPAMPEWPWRRYDAYAVVMILSGAGRYRDPEGHDRVVGPGDAIVVRPGRPHWYGPTDGHWGELFVVFEGPLFDLLLEAGVPGSDEPVRRLDPTWIGRLEDALREQPGEDPIAALLDFARLVVAILAGGAPEGIAEADEDPIAQARRLLASDFGAELALPAVAARVGLSYETFRRRFAREEGKSPGRYRDERRIEAAIDLLATTRLPHRVIASTLGFADEYHFSKRFRALTGRSPRAQRIASTTARMSLCSSETTGPVPTRATTRSSEGIA
jgi:AraC-like DNA-binding protein